MAHEPVPDMVKQYVQYFYRHIREKNVYEILSMYETSFAKITDRYFKASSWPPVEAIAPFVDFDAVFCLLYKEMYYRHVFARLTPTLAQRCASWANYSELFAVILGGNVNMQLPNLWLWEMIDEFIYQFQSFSQYRGKLSQKSAEEIEALRCAGSAWDALAVLTLLRSLVTASCVEATLAAERTGEAGATFSAHEGYDPHSSNVLRVLGYFSLIGLARVHGLLGDHDGCLRALDAVELDKPGLFTKVPGAHVTTLYYVGFAYLSSRRYTDAIRSFNAALVYISRHKGAHGRSPGYEQIQKKADQMFALLALSIALCPAHKLLDEGVKASLQATYTDKMVKMAGGDEAVYDELWSFACPKFVTAAPPDWGDVGGAHSQEAYRTRLRLFLAEARAASLLPLLRSFLQLYTTIPVAKLAALMDADEAGMRALLASCKRQATVLEWRGGDSATNGVWVPTGDTDWFVDGDMVHVVNSKPQQNVVSILVTAIERQRELQAMLA